MERKIGEIFEFGGEWYQCIEGRCRDCYFSEKRFLCKQFITKDFCTSGIIFKKLEKVGEPYEHYEKFYQCYKLPMDTEIRLLPNNCYPIGKDNLVEIEIKQNKEDMSNTETLWYGPDKKEAKSLKLSNLKPFSLEAAKAGKPVCTRDGRKARIICFDKRGGCPIIALVEMSVVEYDCIREEAYYYTIDGLRIGKNAESKDDLMMLPEKKEGWVNVYKDGLLGTRVHNTKKEAFDNASPKDYVATVKINWEK